MLMYLRECRALYSTSQRIGGEEKVEGHGGSGGGGGHNGTSYLAVNQYKVSG